MNLELVGALNELEKERGISKEILREAIEAAIVTAYKRNPNAAQHVRVDFDDRTGRIQVFAQKEVVETVEDETAEMSLEEARKTDPTFEVGDIIEVEVTPRDFGRIAAQTAKQVVIQRIREAERSLIYEEFVNKEGDIVTGIVQRSDHRMVHIDLGKIEASLPPAEQMPGESYQHGNRIKVYITEVRRTTKGPQVLISRTHPGLVKRLFELEVPEIHDGIVEIKALAREPGHRTKIAVASNDPHVDPVGACVGPRGVRVQAVVNELKGEKIDIVAWDADPRRFIANALSPSKVITTYVDPQEMTARAVVPDHQLSLAIGREGQNARLAARLTGWKIDIKSESQQAELAMLEAQRAFDEAEAALRAREEEEARREAEQWGDVEERAEDVAAAETDAPVDAALDLEEEPVEVAADPLEWDDRADEEGDAALDDDGGGEVYDDEADAWADAEEDDLDAWVDAEDDELDGWIDEGDDELEALLLAEDLDEEVPAAEAPPAAPARSRLSRAAKKAEMMALLEEGFLDDEDEPLPSLFEADIDDEENVGVDAGLPRTLGGPSHRGGGRGDKKRGRKGKRVLKDLSDLSDLSEDL